MIKRLDLKTFKCFELLRLPLAPLTLLSGTNASGKSSILQSLVLLHQTMLENEWSTRLILNGSMAELGTVTDVVDQEYGTNGFEIGLSDDDTGCHWRFVGYRSDMSLKVGSVDLRGRRNRKPRDPTVPVADSCGRSVAGVGRAGQGPSPISLRNEKGRGRSILSKINTW